MREDARIYLESLLAPFGPTQPLNELIVAVNGVYHAFEAKEYDDAHDEIGEQLPGRWRTLLETLPPPTGQGWRVLDFGSGTGFASAQALSVLTGRIASLTCFDISPEMLQRGRERLLPLFPQAQFTTTLPDAGATFDLLLTNSVLHHLPDVAATLARIESLLAPNAWWIAGHEPSARFYRNPECLSTLLEYRRGHRFLRFLDPRRYLNRLRSLLLGDQFILTAKRCRELGFFRLTPTRLAINRMVDVGVAHNLSEAESGRGLDVRRMATELAGRWRLHQTASYSFMGDIYEARLPQRWQTRCADLANRHPEDGAQFCAVWQRQTPPAPNQA